jgi:Flp pilus assembly protein TadD
LAVQAFFSTSFVRIPVSLVILVLLGGCVSGPAATTREDIEPIDLSVQFEGLSAEEIIAAGDAAFQMGDYERAEFIFGQAVTLEDTPETWLRLGKTLVYLRKTVNAGQAYDKVLQLDPDNAIAHEELGLLFIGAREVAAGRKYLQRAIELDDTRWPAHNALGVLADTERNYGEAIEHYEAALAVNPDSAMLLTNLGYSHYLSGDLVRAEQLYRTALGVDPKYKRAVANLGLLHARRGDYEEAVVILRQVTERHQAYNDAGFLAYQNGDLESAAWMLSEAIRISPSYYATAYENLEKVQREFKRRGRTDDEGHLAGARADITLRDDHEPEFRRVDAVTLNVRKAAGTDAAVIAYLRPEDSVEVLFDNGDWAFVGFGDGPTATRSTGWVRSKYLVADPDALHTGQSSKP